MLLALEGFSNDEIAEKLGISVDNRMGQYGSYQVVLYSEDAQHFIVDNVDAIVAFALDKGKGAQRNP